MGILRECVAPHGFGRKDRIECRERKRGLTGCTPFFLDGVAVVCSQNVEDFSCRARLLRLHFSICGTFPAIELDDFDSRRGSGRPSKSALQQEGTKDGGEQSFSKDGSTAC